MSAAAAAAGSGATLTPEQRTEVIDGIREFCEQQHLATDAVVALTIHKNYSSEFSSVIVNLKSGALLEVYPDKDACSTYKEGRIGAYLFCYNDQLPIRTDENELILGLSKVHLDDAQCTTVGDADVFCCSRIQPYKARHLQLESTFTDLIRRSGHHPDIVYEVVKQIDNGPIVSTNYYQLEDNRIHPVSGPFTQKIHAFKNYKCTTHGFFYAVDLYRVSFTAGGNVHHMRLNPRSKIHLPFLRQFFTDVLRPKPTSVRSPGDAPSASSSIVEHAKPTDSNSIAVDQPAAGATATSASATTPTSTSRAVDAPSISASVRAFDEDEVDDDDDDDDADAYAPPAYGWGRSAFEDESAQDYTACDKECGYCGHCPY
jgi:hypothetical protein